VPGLRWINTATFHSLHHTGFHGNYGLFTRVWDRLFGTELPGYERAFLGRGRAPDAVFAGRVRVLAVRAESPSTVSLTLDDAALRGAPGQFVQVRFADAWRSYSLSHPDDLRITVKRVPGGKVSGALCDAAAVGMELEVRGPFGGFGAALPVRGRVLFIAGGSGVTPFGAMVPEVTRRGVATRVIVANRSAADAPLVEDLRAVKGAEVVAHVDDAAGMLDEARLAALLGPRPDGVWCCGPEALMDLVRRVVAARWPDVPLVEERFVRAASAVDAPRRLAVVIDGVRRPLEVSPGRSILDAAREAGVAMPSGCEQGACGACRVRVLRGAVATPEGACLRDDERRDGFALACVGAPDDGAEISPSPR
jgi:3-ketosteroid 9alpha-monooxygenase subunit B